MNQVYHNSKPMVRNCLNCAHRTKNSWGSDHCVLCGWICSVQRSYPAPPCDVNLSGWQPRPPRRSLRQWLYDLIWR